MLVLTITGPHKISQCFSQVMTWGGVVGIRARCWEGHYMHICNFTYAHKKVQHSLPPIFTKPTNNQQHYVQTLYADFHPHWKINVESTRGYSLHSKVKYGFHCIIFTKLSHSRAFVDISCTKSQNEENTGKISHIYLLTIFFQQSL